MWIESLLKEIKISISHCPTIWCDNLSTVALSTNLVFHVRTKHVEVDSHFVHDRVLASKRLVLHIPLVEQSVDIFTKPLSISQFNCLRSKLSVINMPLSMRGDMNDKLVSMKLGSRNCMSNDDKSKSIKLRSKNSMSSDDKSRSIKLGSENGKSK